MRKVLIGKLVIILIMALISCNGDDDLGLSGNSGLAGTKWTNTNWDYGIGDDWVSIIDETFRIYFYSNTEGLMCYDRKDLDSDFGSSRDRYVTHFTYKIDGNDIILDYITDASELGYYLDIVGKTIYANGIEFKKGTINSSDKAWIATLTGYTGACKWYHNLKNGLWIIGEGDMGNYSSYAQTPWAKNDRIPQIVTLRGGVTSIGSHAFASPSVGEVDMPYSDMKSIGEYAFQNASISYIFLSNDVKTISEGAFADCSYLTDFYLRNTEMIGDFAFLNCKKVNLYGTNKLKNIGNHAFAGCSVTCWTESDVLETIGQGAFTDCDFSKITLPNSLKEIGHLAFTEPGISTIHIGTGLTQVTGTPFYTASKGKMYVDKNVPLELTDNIVDPDNVGKWTLYVPKGSKKAYSKAAYWKNFGSIVEDTNLAGDGTVVEDNEEENDKNEENKNEENKNDGNNNQEGSHVSSIYSESISYTIYTASGEKTFKTVKVEGNNEIPSFYIMQTEFPLNSDIRVGSHYIQKMERDSSPDYVVTKGDFGWFLIDLCKITGIPFRLPTEKEWMFAAKGGNKSKGYKYSGSDDIDDVAWYKENSGNAVHEFAQKSPNELGLYDMSGNYAELCAKYRQSDYLWTEEEAKYGLKDFDWKTYGGNWQMEASKCTPESWEMESASGYFPGTNCKNKSAFDGRYVGVRLVYTAERK